MNVTARDLKFLALGAVASVGLTTILTSQYYGNLHQPCRIIDSPLPYIRKNLTKQQQDRLPYAPDALDGARDVATPFGSIRVYEWGPEDGRKVLLVHGISTPCIALVGLAEGLVAKGCRVMLFGECCFSTLHHCVRDWDVPLEGKRDTSTFNRLHTTFQRTEDHHKWQGLSRKAAGSLRCVCQEIWSVVGLSRVTTSAKMTLK